MNRIVKVELNMDLKTGLWHVEVLKEFAPENGGGSQVFKSGPYTEVFYALDGARGMVTLHPAQRTA